MNQKNSRSLILILLTLVVCDSCWIATFSSVSFVSQGFEYGTIRRVGIRRAS
jgi:hypothetical protein